MLFLVLKVMGKASFLYASLYGFPHAANISQFTQNQENQQKALFAKSLEQVISISTDRCNMSFFIYAYRPISYYLLYSKVHHLSWLFICQVQYIQRCV